MPTSQMLEKDEYSHQWPTL